jgi:hypothetical protein
MAETVQTPQTALKYTTEVMEDGRVELDVPFPPGARVTVFVVVEPADSFADLLLAAQSSLDFWDNPVDNEDWNNA